MGRLLRSVFVVIGVYALLMSQSTALAGLGAAPGARGFVVGVFFAMELFCIAFIVSLQQPLFAPAEARVRKPVRPAMRALAILFGLLQIYPGVASAVIGLFDAEASDRLAMLGLGAAILLTGFGFIAVGLRGLLRPLPAPESFVEA
jgi:hypothetical protein